MSAFNDYQLIKKGAKEHTCVWCSIPIYRGEKHYRYVGLWQGDFQSWRVHPACKEHVDHCEPEEGICEGPHDHGKPCGPTC